MKPELQFRAQQRDCEEMEKTILVSIVTPTFNSAATLERALNSVQRQNYPAVQHVIVDGGSTDGTLDILRQYERSSGIQWRSEPDEGIADAFNKGIERAKGDLIAILNSDDWYESGAIVRMVEAHRQRKAAGQADAILHGNMIWHTNSPTNQDVRRLVKPRFWGGRDGIGRAFWFDMPVCHPTCFVPRENYLKLGGFLKNYRVAMDYEWMLRAHLARMRFAYVPEVISHFQAGGLSGQHTRLALREVYRAQRQHRVYFVGGFISYSGKMTVNRLKGWTGWKLPVGQLLADAQAS